MYENKEFIMWYLILIPPCFLDMVYIDADKWNYPFYYDKCMELVRKGGLILLDDVRVT